MLVTAIFATLAMVSVAIMLWQWWLGMRFPLYRIPTRTSPRVGLTILKPLKGCDSHTEECLRSWMLEASRTGAHILFGVAEPADPVCALVQGLIKAQPNVDAQLVLCPKRMGANAKVSILIQLSRLAKHETILVSDADVYAPEGLLDRISEALSDPDTALVSCLYADVTPANLWMRLEAVAINGDFWPQVLHARCLGKTDFALGAVMAVRRAALESIGGFESLVNYLADDYQLGHRIAATGAKVELCPAVVECRTDPLTARQVWSHQVRWARTIRVCNPVQYFFSILGNATLWTTVFSMYAAATGALSTFTLSFSPSANAHLTLATTWAGLLMLCTYVGRMASALLLQKRLTARTDHFPWWFLPPLKDVLSVGVWAAAFMGNTVQWRGNHYRVSKGGRLTELSKR